MFYDRPQKKSVVVLTVLSVFGWLPSSARAQSTEALNESPATQATGAKETTVSAQQHEVLYAFRYNEAFADEHFTGKRTKLTSRWSRIKKVSRDGTGAYWMYLTPAFHDIGLGTTSSSTDKSDASLTTICEFSLESRKKLAELDPTAAGGTSTEVELEGTCKGIVNIDGRRIILFRDCKLLKIHKPFEQGSSN